jgi:isoquinoline 1-oxidoreductase beta subunit
MRLKRHRHALGRGAANTPYAFGQKRIEHLIQNTHVPVGFWRSVGGSQNAFAIELYG